MGKKNKTLVEMVNVMILYAKFSINLPGEDSLKACHIHNRISYRKTKITLNNEFIYLIIEYLLQGGQSWDHDPIKLFLWDMLKIQNLMDY